MSFFFFSRTKVQSDSPETGASSKGWISSKAWTESTKLIERGMWGRSFKTWFLLWRNEICFCIFTGVEKNKVTEERERKNWCSFSKMFFVSSQRFFSFFGRKVSFCFLCPWRHFANFFAVTLIVQSLTRVFLDFKSFLLHTCWPFFTSVSFAALGSIPELWNC